MRFMTFIAAIGLLLLALRSHWLRESGGLFLAYASIWCTVWCLHTYLPVVAGDWSQKGMWDAYYRDCTPYDRKEASAFRTHLLTTVERIPKKLEQFPRQWCKEPIMAFRTNWRGEAFYSANTVLPALEIKHLKPFLDRWGTQKPFYLFTERNRVRTELEPALPASLKGRYREVYGSYLKFVLLKIDPDLEQKKSKKPKKSTNG
ncbi:MAG: hypothetical protein VX589_03660 [Myxococcota bacterium]|nr:hypothetical protein [Myxococcota bacterium]